jgi:hypothetical protein
MTATAWDQPSPCQGRLARDGVRHLVEWLPVLLAEAAGPVLAAGPSVDTDPVGAWAALDAQVQVLADPAAGATEIAHPRAGIHRLDEAIAAFFTGDMLIHLELARAGGPWVGRGRLIVWRVRRWSLGRACRRGCGLRGVLRTRGGCRGCCPLGSFGGPRGPRAGFPGWRLW